MGREETLYDRHGPDWWDGSTRWLRQLRKLVPARFVFFDAVVVAASTDGALMLEKEAAAVDWIRDAFGHLKVIGVIDTALGLAEEAGVEEDEGVVEMDGTKDIAAFITAAKNGRVWDREPRLRTPK